MGLTTEPFNTVIHCKNVCVPVKDSTTYFCQSPGQITSKEFHFKEQQYKKKTFLTLQTCSQFAVSRVQNLQGLQGFLCLLDSECQNSDRKELSSRALARELSAVFPTAQALTKPPGCRGVTRMM